MVVLVEKIDGCCCGYTQKYKDSNEKMQEKLMNIPQLTNSPSIIRQHNVSSVVQLPFFFRCGGRVGGINKPIINHTSSLLLLPPQGPPDTTVYIKGKHWGQLIPPYRIRQRRGSP